MSDPIPTAEQSAIIEAAMTGQTTAITAGAGTGKTSTLRMIATAQPNGRILYLAFNKGIQREAAASFPRHATCKTAHALAYAAFGAGMKERLDGQHLPSKLSAEIIGIRAAFEVGPGLQLGQGKLASLALEMVARFCRSAHEQITDEHFGHVEGISHIERHALAEHLLPYAERAWADLTADNGRLKPIHDVYLKQWQLSKPELTRWDVILYDEAQDADPCVASVVERQHHAQLIAVGDSAQAIYGWRGARDFLDRVSAVHRLALTHSWRFGQAIADEANVWLQEIGTTLRLTGNHARNSTIEPLSAPEAILCRTNSETIAQLLLAHEMGVKVHLEGNGKEILNLAIAAEQLQAGKPVEHRDLIAFNTWEEVTEYVANDPGGSDLAVAVQMINRYGARGIMRAISRSVRSEDAELHVSTTHKAKGLEWGTVQVASDFREPFEKDGKPAPIPEAEAMLAYVALTRAKYTLDNAGIAWIHDRLY